MINNCTHFKLIKLTPEGDVIGYYNTNIDPESSWPTKNVDEAQILTAEEVKSVKTYNKLVEKYTGIKQNIHEIGVY